MKRNLLLTALGLAACVAGMESAHAADAARPNIVVVLLDDMGWGQPPCYAPESALRTPHLDRLAAQGLRFTDAHSASAVCTPTRYGVLTGRYPWRIGQFGVLGTWSAPIIPATRMTVASLLKQHGYATACVGKWHLGLKWAEKGKETPAIGARIVEGPNELGFDYFCGFTHARNIGTVIEQDRVIAHVDPVENQPLLIQKALEWIGRRPPDEPFFLYLPLCPPHEPIVPAPDFRGRSGAKDVVGRDPQYGDWVYQGDAMLGQVMDALGRKGMAENTLLIATSDNGAERRAYAPLRASKRSIYEGGHRVPFVARWPGRIKAGSTSDQTICLNDLLATAAEIVGARLPANAAEDSVSFLPALLGHRQSSAREAIVHQSMTRDLALRRGAWKLIFFKNGRRELYHLESDLSETRDVLSAHPAVAEELSALMQRYIDRGRSTPGEVQANEVVPSLRTEASPAERRAKGRSGE